MTTFVTTLFILYIAAFILELLLMFIDKVTLSGVLKILSYVGMGTWAGFLLFAK